MTGKSNERWFMSTCYENGTRQPLWACGQRKERLGMRAEEGKIEEMEELPHWKG